MERPLADLPVLFFDLGGVVLSNGWDEHQRAAAWQTFGLDAASAEAVHHALAAPLETGAMALEAYLAHLAPGREAALRDFMFTQSRALPETAPLLDELAAAGRCRLATLNNEGRELNEFRIAQFGLRRWFSTYCSSCYLGARKPAAEVFQRAAGIVQRPASACWLIDDRAENVAGARAAGFRGLVFSNAARLAVALRAEGLLR